MSGDLKEVFLAFCEATKKGSTTATDKTLKKMCTDAKIYNKKLDTNRVDIEFRKAIGNTKKDADFATFNNFIDNQLAKVYADSIGESDVSKAAESIRNKIIASSPKSHGATKASNDAATKRMTDASGYTGSHKERFDADGKGKGIDGRVDRDAHAAEGYVGNYKGKGTYDKK